MAVILAFVGIAGNLIYGATAVDTLIRVFSALNALMILRLIPIPVKWTKPLFIAFYIFIITLYNMAKEKIPSSPAILALKAHLAVFTLHSYTYEEKGGTKVSAMKLGVDEHCVVKTLVMEDENAHPLIILMHGDKEVSTKSLARIIGAKSILPCRPEIAQKHTGYQVGGTSPFGTRKSLPVYMEKTILDLPAILINAGSRGLLAQMAPAEVVRILSPVIVNVSL
jgi:Cys-tRNA(Pro) deacylase